jgi:hypothetical protein
MKHHAVKTDQQAGKVFVLPRQGSVLNPLACTLNVAQLGQAPIDSHEAERVQLCDLEQPPQQLPLPQKQREGHVAEPAQPLHDIRQAWNWFAACVSRGLPDVF